MSREGRCLGPLIGFFGLLAACTVGLTAQTAPRGNITRGCVDGFDAAADYFPDKAILEDAKIFRIEYHRSYKVVTVTEAYAGGPSEQYVLVQCGTPPPTLDDRLTGAQIVPVPITSLYSASTTHLPLLVELGRLDVLTGVSRRGDLIGDEIARHASIHNIREFSARGTLDAELIVSGRPSLLMAGGAYSGAFSTIRSGGVPVVANVEWLEQTALGRAEWLKYMALFLNEEAKAQSAYAVTKAHYRRIAARVAAAPESSRPLVMAGRANRGTFLIAGGRSYVAALITDAGGRYVWPDNAAAGSPSMELEAQVRRAANADIWINGGGWKTLAAMLEDEPRYAELKAYRNGQVWVYERRVTPEGGNDYWSRAVSHPDLVLADLAKIFHPSLMKDHEFQWYIHVPER
jgi:iron complex transport system substrate-binding protein